MCGRYYIDDETAREIEKIVREVNEKLISEKRNVHPSSKAPVVVGNKDVLAVEEYTWGFRHYNKTSSVIFNARAETAMDKKMFKSSIQQRRLAVPAAGFFEWNANKDKYYFHSEKDKVLWLAGFYQDDRFVILTTAANSSIEDIHPRMPLTLEPAELKQWIFDNTLVEYFLNKVPKQLTFKYMQSNDGIKLLTQRGHCFVTFEVLRPMHTPGMRAHLLGRNTGKSEAYFKIYTYMARFYKSSGV